MGFPQQLIKLKPRQIDSNGPTINVDYSIDKAKLFQDGDELFFLFTIPSQKKIVLYSITSRKLHLLPVKDAAWQHFLDCIIWQRPGAMPKIILAFKNAPLMIWDLNTNRATLTKSPYVTQTNDIVLDDGKTLLISDDKNYLYWYDLEKDNTPKKIIIHPPRGDCKIGAFKCDEKEDILIIKTDKDELLFLLLETGVVFKKLKIHPNTNGLLPFRSTLKSEYNILMTCFNDNSLHILGFSRAKPLLRIFHQAAIRCYTMCLVDGQTIFFSATEDRYLHYSTEQEKPIGKPWRLPCVAIALFAFEQRLYIVLENGDTLTMPYERIPHKKNIHKDHLQTVVI